MIRIVPSPRERTDELFDLCGKVFALVEGGYYETVQHCRGGYWTGSSYDWDVSQAAIEDDKIVSHIGVWKYPMRVGKARLMTGGIGAVMTAGACRKRGLSARVWDKTILAMREGGYDFSILFGIRDFYHRFGYVQAWPSTDHVLKTASLPEGAGKLRLRKVDDRQPLCGRGAIMRIYECEHADIVGTAVRPIYTLTHGLSHKFEVRALCNSGGRTKGYVVTRAGGGDLQVLEVGGVSAGCGADELLRAIRVLAGRAQCKRVRFRALSYAHPMSEALRTRDCTVEMHYSGNARAMALVVSLEGCLRAMEGELTSRLRASAARKSRGVVNVVGDGETVALRIADGKVRVAKPRAKAASQIIAGAHAARLIIGSESPETLAAQGQVRFTGAADQWARVIFPKRWPMLNQLDHF